MIEQRRTELESYLTFFKNSNALQSGILRFFNLQSVAPL